MTIVYCVYGRIAYEGAGSIQIFASYAAASIAANKLASDARGYDIVSIDHVDTSTGRTVLHTNVPVPDRDYDWYGTTEEGRAAYLAKMREV
jgi:hypothetical protein